MNLRIMTLLLAAGLMAGCSETNKEINDASDVRELASEDTAVMFQDIDEEFWGSVDFESPAIEDAEMTERGIEVRGNANGYNIYAMDERILFDLDKAQLREGADEKLRSIAESINEVSDQGPIRIFGFTDSIASEAYNEQLAADRANTVKDWLQNNTDIDASRLSIQAVGEGQPRATNETARGRQLNRRVAVVVATKR